MFPFSLRKMIIRKNAFPKTNFLLGLHTQHWNARCVVPLPHTHSRCLHTKKAKWTHTVYCTVHCTVLHCTVSQYLRSLWPELGYERYWKLLYRIGLLSAIKHILSPMALHALRAIGSLKRFSTVVNAIKVRKINQIFSSVIARYATAGDVRGEPSCFSEGW